MSEERNYESEAKADGWTPKEEWKGDESKWVDAKTFVEKGEKISGILKSKISRLEERVESLTESNAKFKTYTDAQMARERKKNETLIAELEKIRKEAITDGDGDAFDAADKRIKQLQQQEVAPPVDTTAEHKKLADAWTAENPWYATNEKLGRYADGVAEQIVAQGFTGKAYFDELTKKVKETFPEEFQNSARSRPNGVEEGGGQGASQGSKKHTWDNLPEEAKAAAKRFEKDIPGFSRDDYVANYEWD